MPSVKLALPRSIPTGPWGPETAEAIQQNFERIYGSSGRIGQGGGMTFTNGLDGLMPAVGDIIACLTTAGIYNSLPIVGTVQRVLTNNGGVPTWAVVNLASGVTGVLPLANIVNFSATQRLWGRNSAGAGVAEEVTLTQVLDWISGSVAQGDLLYRGSSAWARLAAGTSGQVLTTSGVGANPVWAGGSGTTNVGFLSSSSFYSVQSADTSSVYLTLGARSAPTGFGTIAAVVVSGDGFYQNFTPAASIGANAGLNQGNPMLDWSLPFDFTWIIQTGASVANVRYWMGFAASGLASNSDTYNGGTRFIGFRYSTVVPDGGWVGVTNNGTSQTVSATVAAIAASTIYKLRLRGDGSANVFFSVNGSAEQQISATYPGGATLVGPQVQLTAITNAQPQFRFKRLFGYYGL